MEICRHQSVPVQSAGNQTEPVRKALATGLFTNVARLTRDGHYVTVRGGALSLQHNLDSYCHDVPLLYFQLDSHQKVRIHPSSVFFQTKPEMVVFTEMIGTQHSYIRDLTLVDPAWLTQSQPEYFRQHRIVNSAGED